MYLDPEDRQIAIDYLVKSRLDLKHLSRILILKKEYKKALKENLSVFHDDIQLEYVGACKGIIAEEVSRNTGLTSDAIIYLLDEMGLENFLQYLGGGKFKKLK